MDAEERLSPDGPRHARLATGLACAALVAFAAVCLATAWNAQWRSEWDSAIYLLTARSLAAGEGYVYAGEPFLLRPPGLSVLLAPFVGGSGEPGFRGIHVLLAVFAVSSFAALYAALRARGRFFALAVAVLGATSPAMVERLHWVHSEFPFLAFLFAGVALAERSFRSEGRWWWGALLAAVCLAAAYYLRSVAVVMVPALVGIPLVFHPGRRWRGLLPAAAFVVLALPWMVHTRSASDELTVPPDQLLLHDYGTALFHTDPGNPGSPAVPFSVWRSRVAENVPAVSGHVAEGVLHTEAPWTTWLLVAVTALGWGVAVRRGPGLLEWFAAAYAGVLFLYFDEHPRLSAPLVLFAYLYGAHAVRAIAARANAVGRWAVPALCGLLLSLNVTSMPYALDAASQPAETLEGDAIEGVTRGELWGHVRAMAQWLRDGTEEDHVVLCHRAPILALLSGRECYTYRFARGRNLFRKYEPDVVMFDGRPPSHLPSLTVRRAERHEVLTVGPWQIAIYWMKGDSW